MTLTTGFTRIFDNEALVPQSWRDSRGDGFRVFNPSLLADGDGYIMAYRVVSEALGRKIAFCRLNANLDIIADSVTPFSDHLLLDPDRYPAASLSWHADPRLFRLDGRDYLYWNDGYKKPHNNQFVCAIDRHALRPVGRPLLLGKTGDRQMIEKNWGLFFDGQIKALYASEPFTVLAVRTIGEDDLLFEEIGVRGALVPSAHSLGLLRGGAAPILWQGEYYHFCHATFYSAPSTRSYKAAVFTFDADCRAGVRRIAQRAIELPNPFASDRLYPPLNPNAESVIYVCGALRLPEGWLLAYGIDDERCALHLMSQAQVDDHMMAAVTGTAHPS
jgi:hypothetical protein